jgi:phosphoglycolate phosphatase
MNFDVTKITTLLFDLDGTLIDSTADIASSVNALRVSLGLPTLAQDTVASYVGDGVDALVRRVLDKQEVADEVEAFKLHYHEHCVDQTRCYAGVEETLRVLHVLGYKMAVVTNKPERISKHILERLGLGKIFGSVIGGNSAEHKKPHPAPLFKACAELGSSPALACMIGDSRVDMEAGHNAGMPSLGLLGGIGDEALLRRSGPALILESFSELTRHFKGQHEDRH